MAKVLRPAGYTGLLQRMVWTQGNAVSATAYLWGGGGGAGGADSNPGGNGGGSGFSQVNFTVNEGDTIEIAVGGGGGGGQSGAGNGAGGTAGASLVEDYQFNTRDATASPPVYPQFNSAYCTFLNTYGVWVNPTSAAVFDRTYTVNFPTTGNYQFTACADNSARFFIDGVEAFYADNFTAPWTIGYPVTAGTHYIRILGTNTGGPGAVALTIGNGASYSGGRGGNSGPSGSSGAGGGGGGATVLLLNNSVIGVAGGGGGGGGGGNSGAATGGSAPGPNGQASGENSGQNGTNKAGDGGGGGGGGGGYAGGNGGNTPGGDQGGYAGYYGSGQGDSTANPSARTPGGTNNQYWRGAGQGGASNGGPGIAGYAMFEFDVSGIFVHDGGSFTPVTQTYIKANGTWNPVKSMFIKQGSTWIPVNGSIAPAFENVPNRFGVNPRSGSIETPGGDVISGGGDPGGADGGGGGGGKIICTKLYELGLMDREIYEADQAFGAELVKTHPDIYNGYRAWAEIVVDWMDGNGPNMMPWLPEQRRREITQRWSTSWAKDIATPWAEEMAYQMGQRLVDNSTGKAIMAVGTPICKVVGVWQRVFGPSKKPAGFGKGLMLIPVFVVLKGVAELGKLIERK